MDFTPTEIRDLIGALTSAPAGT